ncbi:putative histone-lysine N-methyltransferase [Trypoxylus dichotomus]
MDVYLLCYAFALVLSLGVCRNCDVIIEEDYRNLEDLENFVQWYFAEHTCLTVFHDNGSRVLNFAQYGELTLRINSDMWRHLSKTTSIEGFLVFSNSTPNILKYFAVIKENIDDKDVNKTSDVLRKIQKKDVDFVFSPLFVTDYLQPDLGFLEVLAEDALCVIVPKSNEYKKIAVIPGCFTIPVWILLSVFFSLVVLSLYIIAKVQTTRVAENRRSFDYRIQTIGLDGLQIVLNISRLFSTRKYPIKVFFIITLLSLVVLNTTFQSSLYRLLALPSQINNINNLEELAETGLIVSTSSDNLQNTFKFSNKPYMKKLKLVLLDKNQSKHVAYLERLSTNVYQEVVDFKKYGDTKRHLIPECPQKYALAHITRKDSILADAISKREDMDDSEDHIDRTSTGNKVKAPAEKPKMENKDISPLGISRYGRTRKPKISQDFCNIDDAIDDNTDEQFVKPPKTPTKIVGKTKAVNTNVTQVNGVQVVVKDTVTKSRHRITHKPQIVHITGDSDMANASVNRQSANIQKSQKPLKVSVEENKLPVNKSFSVTKENVSKIKDEKLSEELKPILSEEIFQTPSIDVAEVFKIISNKPNDLEVEKAVKNNSKGIIKTYTNKRKTFHRQSSLIESFGLPDEPIVPVDSDKFMKPLRISEIDVDMVKPETVNLIDRELIDSLWKISSSEEDYICNDDVDITSIPVFDIRCRFTPERDIYCGDTKIAKNYNVSPDKIHASSRISNRGKSKCKILRSNTEENVISNPTPKLKSIKTENVKNEEKQTVIKRIINKNAYEDNSNDRKENSLTHNTIAESPIVIKKERIDYDQKSSIDLHANAELRSSPTLTSKKGICALVYERDMNDASITELKPPLAEIGDIEDHIKVSLIDKAKRQEILGEDNKKGFVIGIDINKLKNQINSRMEMIKLEEDESNVEKGEQEIKEKIEVESVASPVAEESRIPSPREVDEVALELASSKKDEKQIAVGDLMWAKIGRYPYWPCLITKEPHSKEYRKIKLRNVVMYHVRFFGDNGRRSWISFRHLLPYGVDLHKMQKENKNVHIIPNNGSRSYRQWLTGVQEADNLKDKPKKDKFDFFNHMLLNNRRRSRFSKKRHEKLDKVVINRGSPIRKKLQKKFKTASTGDLKKEILENLTDMLNTSNIRTTRSSFHRRSSAKSYSTVESKDDDDTEILDNDSGKQSTPSRFSDDESTQKSFFPLTLESQIALYKRNNLFKGVTRERVCQICEKPNGVIKCKGRCNGYYHISCANKKENFEADLYDSFNDQSMDISQLQLDNTSDTSQIQEEIKTDESKVEIDVEETAAIEKSVQKEDKKPPLRSRGRPRSHIKPAPVELKLKANDVLLETINVKDSGNTTEKVEEHSEELKKDFQRKSRRSRNYTHNLSPSYRRITRSQSQEREIVPPQVDVRKRRRVKSQRNSISEDLGEIDISSLLKPNVKEEGLHDGNIEITFNDIEISDNCQEKSNKLMGNPQTLQPVAVEHSNATVTKSQGMSIQNTVQDCKELYKKPELIKNCNVKIVHIKDRKKTGISPKLALKQDPEFEKLPILDQIDETMKDVMQTYDKKPLYADSTTDYTGSEDSAVDLLSPKNKKLLDDALCQNGSPCKPASDDDASVNLMEDKKRIPFKGVKTNKCDESQTDIDFKCFNCLEDIDHPCFVCHKEISKKGSSIRQKCSLFACGKFYHPECLKLWPQTQWSVISTTKHKLSNTNLDTFVCPNHVCHTCVSDDPRAAIPRCTSDKVVKCLRCPATYHNSAHCIPAGTIILTSTQIVCPRHLIPKRILKRTLPIINTTWCFICSEGGDLICCEMCPTSVHLDCLKINLTEDDNFICEDCETGRFPLYDEIVWVKFSTYRWWPAVILFPNEVPDNIKTIKHKPGEFVVRFFGTNNYYWIGRGRVFLFQEGDSGDISGSSHKKTYHDFKKSIEEATEAHRLKKEFKQAIIEETAIKSKHKPPHYIKIKVNRPVGNVRQFDGNVSNTTPCECDPKNKNPCGADSDCLNRLLLTECDPEVCPAGEKCQNQNFEKRNYPPLIPYKTETRGWGLKSLEPLKKGQFVIEYVGEMIDEQEYQRRINKMHEQKEENYYFLTIDKDRMLDAGPKGNVARFMNHSCQPNCETQKWTVNGDTRVGLFAMDDIPANTELTFNYNLECVGKEKKICKCGASNCSGFIGVKAKQVDKKQEESRKRFKSKLRHKRKKNSVAPQPVNNKPCFICGVTGEVIPCNNKICTKSYHLQCVNLETWPDNKWACPWHNCKVCTKRTIRCCVKCINSYCPVHSDGYIRYDRLLGFVCFEHDPNKAHTPEIQLEDIPQRIDLLPQKITEENDVTSTTFDEQDSKPPESLVGHQSMEKKPEETPEVVTSSPQLPLDEDNNVPEPAPTKEDTVEVKVEEKVEVPMKRKRGRSRKDERLKILGSKRVKLDGVNGTVTEIKKEVEENERLSPANELTLTNKRPTRNLRTPKSVNYSGVSDKIRTVQKKLGNDLPIRKRLTARNEATL